MRRFTRLALVALPALALAGCATMNVYSHLERGVDFTQYRTYAWGPTDARSTGDPRLDSNPFFKDRLEGAVEKQLTTKRFEKSTSTTPDLLIHYHANITQRFEVNTVDRSRGYCSDDCEPTAGEYDDGTLVLDMVDVRTNKVVWRGSARGVVNGLIDNQDLMEQKIDEAVRRMLESLPRHL
jgi:PBP1b-binding outer membrane lipoprotein LpoB